MRGKEEKLPLIIMIDYKGFACDRIRPTREGWMDEWEQQYLCIPEYNLMQMCEYVRPPAHPSLT